MASREDRMYELETGEHTPDEERVTEVCSTCDGAAEIELDGVCEDCRDCNGTGLIDITDWEDDPYYEPQRSFL